MDEDSAADIAIGQLKFALLISILSIVMFVVSGIMDGKYKGVGGAILILALGSVIGGIQVIATLEVRRVILFILVYIPIILAVSAIYWFLVPIWLK